MKKILFLILFLLPITANANFYIGADVGSEYVIVDDLPDLLKINSFPIKYELNMGYIWDGYEIDNLRWGIEAYGSSFAVNVNMPLDIFNNPLLKISSNSDVNTTLQSAGLRFSSNLRYEETDYFAYLGVGFLYHRNIAETIVKINDSEYAIEDVQFIERKILPSVGVGSIYNISEGLGIKFSVGYTVYIDSVILDSGIDFDFGFRLYY